MIFSATGSKSPFMKQNAHLSLLLVFAFALSSSAGETTPTVVPPPPDDPGWSSSANFIPVRSFYPLRSGFAVAHGLTVDDPPHEKRAAVALEFARLTPFEQRMVLIQPLWPRVRCADFRAALEPLLKTPSKPEGEEEDSSLDKIIVALCDLHSGRARRFLLEDMQRSKPLLSLKALLYLPAEDVPDAEIQKAFARNLDEETADLFKLMPLIAKYGTRELLPQVTKFYQQREGRWACTIEVAGLQYWIKHDLKEGLAALVRSMNSRKKTGCYRELLSETLPAVYSPSVEKATLLFLQDPDIAVALNAASTLARHGSLPARRKLVEWIGQYPAGALVKSINDQREWNPRAHVVWELSEGRIWPFDGHSHPVTDEDLALVRPLMSNDEWRHLQDSITSFKQFDETLK